MDAKTRKLLADEERRQLLAQERLERERQERREVRDGVAEIIDLGEHRGEAFLAPKVRNEPIRRLTGLEHLQRLGKLSDEAFRIGLEYGECYRDAAAEPNLKSCLSEPTGGMPPNPSALIQRARRRLLNVQRLHAMRLAFGFQADLVRALDLVCGQEKTPREASRNGQEAAKLEALVIAGLGVIQAQRDLRRAA